ncbi:Protoporphyrinogen oxidase [Basidiobolus meristosporus CBS 931.73]|uniref:Protoporphyrinogen oxidase n=1 Tax=Basidiobolus meristosporus CBS 931.73 TaxID=1314790 RepID=A0A1Y1Y8A3_9FUNG|nr:Protoporphyrinogen oxidase [Basidiobolus meristosporus CBS 931.73]|eukprot:ORX94252.1 Protoporphyrinogen oxidase [Basidiobolus meristosporus CBS 931.73]
MKQITILGGGISGLSAAWYLAKALPATTRIVLLERSAHLGGWLNSHRSKSGTLFETGPRSLRPKGYTGLLTLNLASELGLTEELLVATKSSPASKHRLIYRGDQLHLLPYDLNSLLFKQPEVLRGTTFAFMKEPFVPARRDDADESIHDFIARRLSPKFAEDIVGAVIHGIYAGDAKNLSLKAVMPFLHEAERKYGSIILGGILGMKSDPRVKELREKLQSENPEMWGKLQDASIYSFKEGIQALSDGIVRSLKRFPNVILKTEVDCDRLEFGQVAKVVLKNGESYESDHVISTIPSTRLAPMLPKPIPTLSQTVGADVGVVNLSYAGKGVLPIDGFGYLVSPAEKEAVLGVVFDSSNIPEQDAGKDITRMTAMIGGHRFKELFGEPESVDPEHLLHVAKSTIARHIGVSKEPLESQVSIQAQCIPQYTVGHRERLGETHAHLKKLYPNQLSVTGASYLGVSVNDCVASSYELVNSLVATEFRGVTGLEKSEED